MPEFRTPVMTLVEASWEDSSGVLLTVPARMEDKSARGACIRIKTPIGVGTRLSVQWRFEQFSGTARYCRSAGKDYLVGIQRDVANRLLPNQSVPTGVPPPKGGNRGDAPAAPATTQALPKWQEGWPEETPMAVRKIESAPIVHTPNSATAMSRREAGHETDNPDSLRVSRLQEFDAIRRARFRTKRLPNGKESGKERKRMPRKWLDLPWRNKQDSLSVSGDGKGNGEAGGNGSSNGESQENPMPHVTQPADKASLHSASDAPDFQVELFSIEDICRTAGIMIPRKGYSIKKVVEMLNSEHIRGLSKEMKRVALLMALDAAGVPLDEVLQDAKARQNALDAYEAQQRKQFEADWARKAEEIAQIQAELENIKAHYMARISRSQERVAQQKTTFASWVSLKQQECQSMAEAVELCLKVPVPEPAIAPPPETSLVKAAAAGAGAAGAGAASGARGESRSDAIH
jgi:hypothetical protein